MNLQSIRRTRIPGVRREVDLRTYRENWPELRLRIPSDGPHMGDIRGKIDVVLADSGDPDGHGCDRDDDGHATDLRATILGRQGRSAANINVRAIKCFSAQAWPRPDEAAAAIANAGAIGRSVFVLAWDTGHDTDTLRDTLLALKDKPAVVVIAAGNWALNTDEHHNWPANHGDMDHVLTVMAADEHDERASYSSYGKKRVYIAAPGLALLDAAPSSSPLRQFGSLRDRVREFRGTSAATAHVARLAALVWLKNPDWTPQEVKKHIGRTARKVKALKKYCAKGGIADFAAALK